MIWLSSDLHMGHTNILKYCNRPFSSVNKMNNCLIDNWNKKVQKEDVAFILGDFTLETNPEKVKSWLESMNGHKHYILGNHSNMKPWQYINCGFESVHTSYEIKLEGFKCFLAHDPVFKNMLNEEDILLCGHVHQLWKIRKENKTINVGVDVWNYEPVDYLKILEIIKGNYYEEINASNILSK